MSGPSGTKLPVDGRLRDLVMFNLATQTSGMNFVEENGGGSVPADEKGRNVILHRYSAGEYLHAIAKHGLRHARRSLFGKMDGLARTQRDSINDRVSRAFERCDAAELVGLFRLDQRSCTSLC